MMHVPEAIASIVSDNIVENCLYGHDSHGMTLLPRFVSDIKIGKIKPEAKSKIEKKSVCSVQIDGNRGFGQVTMTEAMNIAVDIAKDTGISAVTVTNCNHVGILWSFVKTAADKGAIGMIWCASGPQGGLVAPYGGIKRAIGANPLGIAIPAGDMNPLVLDFSTSAVAGGKIVLHAQKNKKIPYGWLLDKDGRPTDDPNKLIEDGQIVGHLLSMGGYKGFGLGMVIELLGGVLTGYGPSYIPEYKEGNGLFIIAVDIEKFMPLKEFGSQTDALFQHVKAVPTDSQTKEIMIPGEIEYKTRAIREKEGVPVTKTVWDNIITLSKELGIIL